VASLGGTIVLLIYRIDTTKMRELMVCKLGAQNNATNASVCLLNGKMQGVNFQLEHQKDKF
jgi:hypothetical protein